MNRRDTLIAGGTLAAMGAAALVRARTPGRTYRIGFLGYTAANTAHDERVVAAFVQHLRELGFCEGRNLVIDMPVVVTAVGDPVRSGLVVSLSHPGGQVTGIANFADELVPKRLELLKAAVPTATRTAMARCPRCQLSAGNSAAEVGALLDQQVAAARTLGVKLLPLDVNAAADSDAAIAALQRDPPDAILIGATQINVALQSQWRAFEVARRIPTLAPYRGFGVTLSYGPEYAAIFHRAAEYVARILNGAKPADMPMEQPTKFEFVVNLKIARSIGLTIPRQLLLRADEVIE